MAKIFRILLLILLLATWAYIIDMECLLATPNDSFCAEETRGQTICLCSAPSIPQQKSVTIQDICHYPAALLAVFSLLPESNEKVYEKPFIPSLKIDFNSATIPRAPPIA